MTEPIDPATERSFRDSYDAFNRRDIDAALALMTDDVAWANGWEGGYVHGQDEVRAYWLRQWAAIDPHVEPRSITLTPAGSIDVEVDQTVRDADGKLLSSARVHHLYTMRSGRVARFDLAPQQ